jgi:FlaA1/EpsC-like NDP-sugar epimerase
VSNRERMRQVFERWRPSVVFHAAAHKHVPLMEQNPEEAFFNNVVGTRNVAELCADFDVERFVNVSTDKAVRPSSVMGASKRMAEAVVKEVAQRAKLKGRLVSVRFGNVLGSRGSVVPTFQRQIAAGGPVTVTDPDMQRYFMTIPEACQLLLQAAADPVNASTYLLDMGSPVRILDLAEQLIRLSGLTPYEDIAIEFTGRRPGEKLYEELTTEFESSQVTNNPRIVVVSATDLQGAPLREVVDRMRVMAERGEGEQLSRELVALFGREYVPRENGAAAAPTRELVGRPSERPT